jgi:hypothetical protein
VTEPTQLMLTQLTPTQLTPTQLNSTTKPEGDSR